MRRWTSRGGIFVAEEGLIEGVDAGGEPGVQGVDAGGEGGDIGAHFLAERGDVLADAGNRSPKSKANPQDRDDDSDGVREAYPIT